MADVRVHELAKEFGVESKVVLAKLRDMGEFVKSASSRLRPEVVERLIGEYGEELRSAPYTPPMPPGWYDDADRPTLRPDPAVKPIHHGRRPRSAPIDRPRKTSWDASEFDEGARRLWLRYGLGDHDAKLAMYLLERGILPEDLRVRLRGRSAVSRLRGGEESWQLLVEEMREQRAFGERPEPTLPSAQVMRRRKSS